MTTQVELEKDLQELQALLQSSTRPRPKKLIEDEIKKVTIAIENVTLDMIVLESNRR
jgi:hypothetical protein